MKLYISIDAEGCTGINSFAQVTPSSPDFAWARERITQDLLAAIEGARDAGVEQILVNDAHEEGTNVILESLPSCATLIRGLSGRYSMMEGLNSSFDAVFMLGYHARRGSAGVLAHTYFPQQVRSVLFDDVPVGEFAINAALAGAMGVPVALVSGDNVVANEAGSYLPYVRAAIVKRAVSNGTAECMPPQVTYEGIRATAREALKQQLKLFVAKPPREIEVRFFNAAQAEYASMINTVERLDSARVRMDVHDYKEDFVTLLAAMLISTTAKL
ncbi:D-aminopeptidase [bioreactor metagenome]|uniref:D-aminopeptidase n=1 Tax=bioreactor metagenome TaxID=1076179 RepID=A0A645C6D6_9ZZZZ